MRFLKDSRMRRFARSRKRWFTKWGVTLRPDGRELRFALRTSASAILALLVASYLGFSDPFWAPVTAWVLAIPGRGAVLVKSLYRIVGTIGGAIAALGLLALTDHPGILIVCLSVWISTCATIATAYRGLRAYAAHLAGYTAIIILVVALQDAADMRYSLALERTTLVLVGILSSTLLAYLFARPQAVDELQSRARALVGQSVEVSAEILERGLTETTASQIRTAWNELIEFETLCSFAAVETVTIRERLGAVRRLTLAQLKLVSSARALRRGAQEIPVLLGRSGAALREAAVAIREGRDIAPATGHILDELDELDGARCRCELAPLLCGQLTELADALTRVGAETDFLRAAPSRERVVPLSTHYDWRTALALGFRAGLASLIVASLWILLKWDGGGFVLIFVSASCLLHGTQPNPAPAFRRFALAIAAAGGTFALYHSLPFRMEGGLPLLHLCTFLPTYVGALALANRFVPAMDFNANFTALMLGTPIIQGFMPALAMAVGLILGIGAAAGVCLTPITPTRKQVGTSRSLQLRMLAAVALGHKKRETTEWEASLYDQLVQSQRGLWSPARRWIAMQRCLLTLDIGLEVSRLRRVARGANNEHDRAVVSSFLYSLSVAKNFFEISNYAKRAAEQITESTDEQASGPAQRHAFILVSLDGIARSAKEWDLLDSCSDRPAER